MSVMDGAAWDQTFMPDGEESATAASVGSLKDDDGLVARVNQAAARNQLEAEAGLGEGDRIEVGAGIEELPLARGATGKLQPAIGLELRGGVFIVMDGHGGVGADDLLDGTEGRVEFHSAGRGDGVIAAGADEATAGREDGEDHPSGRLEVADHGGRAGLLERGDGSGLNPGSFFVGQLDGERGVLGVAEQAHGVIGHNDRNLAGTARESEIVVADEVVDSAGIGAGLQGRGMAGIKRLRVGGGSGKERDAEGQGKETAADEGSGCEMHGDGSWMGGDFALIGER